MLNIGKKKYRNLQEQVGYNTKEIEKLFSILDGIDYEDHVVVIQDISIPLTKEEMSIVLEPVSFLVYEDKLYFKDSADENNLYFSAVINIEGTALITINLFKIAVNISNGVMSIIDTESTVYSSDKIDETVANLKTLISGLADGSPKGVFATLADLQSAYPTGAEGIYVVRANGHWYYWDGTAWSDGGPYTSVIDYDAMKQDIVYLNNKTTNKDEDLLPHISSCYKQGGIDNTASTRISTTNFIKVSGWRLYIKFTGTALVQMYIDTYTGEEGNYTHFLGYGYYSADNYIGISNNNITAIKITFKKPDNGNITPDEVESLTKNVVAYLVDARGEDSVLPIKLRIMQYNIGKFNYGERGGLSTNVEEKIEHYKSFIAQYRPDICCLEEYPMSNYTGYIPTIDSDGEYYPDEVIFDNSYYYKTSGYFGNETKTNIPYKSETDFSIDESDSTYRTKGILTVYTLHGKSVGIINGWFNVDAPVEKRLAQLNDCIARLQNYDIGIICVDSNVASQTELDNMNSVAKTAGYVASNGEYFGYFSTLSPQVSPYKCIDQIWVKGAKIVNAERPDVFASLSSDHYPLVADIVID